MNNQIDDFEKLLYEECYEKVDKHLLILQMKYVIKNSFFYKEKYKKFGLSNNQVVDISNFKNLPFTYKNEIIEEQNIFPPYGRLATHENSQNLRRVHITSGSTGKPLYIILTENDLAATIEAGRRAFHCAGLTSHDTVIHCLNYCLWAGGITDHLSLEATGATIIPFGVGNSEKLIQTILELQPTAISCTPSYLSRLEYLLTSKFNLSPVDLGLKKAIFGGEAGIQNPKIRSRIEETWKMKAIDANYGMADVLSIFGSECNERQGLHFHGQGILYVELIDPLNKKNLPISDGIEGELVLTHLKREAQPLVRFRTRDFIKIVSTKKCTCGRSSFRFLILGRTDNMITVKGINVYPNAIANILSERSEWFSGEFEIVLDTPPPVNQLFLRIELYKKVGEENSNIIKSFFIQRCKRELSFTPRIELIPFGKLPRTEGKSRRIRKRFK